MILHARVITGAGGGPDKTILNSPRFLTELGFRSVCAFLRPPGDGGFQTIRARAREWCAPIVEIDDRGALDWRVFTELLRRCRELQVKVWHAHDYKTNLLGLMLRRFHPMHLVTTVHGWVEHTWRTRLYYLADRWTLPRYGRVMCVSADLLETCRNYAVPTDKCCLIENAIDMEQFRRTTPVVAAKQSIGWAANRSHIGAVGRLSAEKAFDVLIRAFHELIRRRPDVDLVIAGDGPERSRLEDLIRTLNLQDRVTLLGFQTDLRPIYEALDLFVLSSVREALPNVLLEAMALEVPVVATRVAGIPLLISDGQSGVLAPPNDISALANSMQRLLAAPELRLQLAGSARRTIEQRYSFAARMKKEAAVYNELLIDRTSASGPR
jgi:glycosyltransferase involved in cell wall biosynthesis